MKIQLLLLSFVFITANMMYAAEAPRQEAAPEETIKFRERPSLVQEEIVKNLDEKSLFEFAKTAHYAHELVKKELRRRHKILYYWSTGINKYYRIEDLKEVTLPGNTATSVACSPIDKNIIASGSSDGTVTVWDVGSIKALKVLPSTSAVNTIAFSHNGEALAAGYEDGTIKLWSIKEGSVIKSLSSPGAVYSLAFFPNGGFLTSVSKTTRHLTVAIMLWDLTTGKGMQKTVPYVHSEFGDSELSVNYALVSTNGQFVGLWANVNPTQVDILDVATGTWKNTPEVWHLGIMAVTFSTDEKQLAVGFSDNTIKVWDMQTGEQKKEFRYKHADWIRSDSPFPTRKLSSMAFSWNENLLAVGDRAGAINLINVENGKEIYFGIEESPHTVNTVLFSADDKSVVSLQSGTIKLWYRERGR